MIKEFQSEDAQNLADMFNASDEGWPGGFTRGMPVTKEIILEHMKKEKPVSTSVVWDKDTIVGMLELMEFWRDTNVLYVGFLNVIPSHQGKGYGRDLLKVCVEKSAALQCKRLDLHTWAGNMKAVPVYKKTGFFWVPKTLVHMKNFLPLILNMDVAKPYFEKHDWYKTFKREIKVEEDDFDGSFPYHWEEGGDMLSVVIDAESGGVTTFEDNTFFISQKKEDAFSGNFVTITWTIKNKIDTPLHVTLLSRGEKGISIDKKESVTVEGNKTYETTEKAFVDYDINIKKEIEPPHVITTEVVVNGKALSLVSGLRVNHAVDILTDPEHLFLPKGTQKILAVLKNNKKTKVEGVITLQNTNESQPFCIQPDYTEAVPFTITIDTDGELQMYVNGSNRIHTIPVRVMDGANVMQKENEVILENVHTRIIVSLLGGETSFYDKKTRKFWAKHMSEELGPPFWPSELFKTMYAVKTRKYPGKVIAEFYVDSKKYNARLTRRIEMDQSPVVKIQCTLVPQKDVQLHVIGEENLSGGIVTIPLKEGIVSEYTMEDVFPLEDGDLPKDPSAYKEEWVCYQQDGSAFGVVWESCTEMEVCGNCLLNIYMDATQLKPVYLYLGSGTWKDVRAVWSRIHQKEVLDEPVKSIWEVNPSVVMTADDTITPVFTLESHRNRPFKGVINGHSFDVKRGTPFIFNVVYDNLELGVNTTCMHIETDLFEKEVPVSIVRAGRKGDILICEGDTIDIDNGLYTVTVAPQYYGSVIFFGKEKNHVLTPYPETTQLAWFRPWYGGIHPIVFTGEEHKFPGRMHKETFSYDIVTTEKYGILWKGVKVTSALQEVKGITVETSYVTCAFSNVLVIEHSIQNVLSAPVDLHTGVSFFLQPDGAVTDAVLYYYQKELQERRRTQYGGRVDCNDWAAVKGQNTVLTLVTDPIAAVDLGKEGAHLFTVKKIRAKPHSTVTTHSYFVAADSLDQAQKYKALRGITW